MSDSESGDINLTEAFHRLGRILPDEQTLVVVRPDTLAGEALRLMQEHSFSQMPVSLNGHVFGVFSYRSFAKKVAELGEELLKERQIPADLEVEECMEPANFAHISDDFSRWFDVIDKQDVILIGQPERTVGVLTAIDILRYLYGVASPFVLIAEIEISLRALIRQAIDDDQLRECCDRCLNHYKDENRPYQLEEMTFSDYVSIVGHGKSWDMFKSVFGGSRMRTSTKLKEVNDLRNVVFHFRREVAVEEYQRLGELRDWVLRKAMTIELSTKGGVA